MRVRRKKPEEEPKEELSKHSIGHTIDYSDLKTFIDYGQNRVLNELKLKSEARYRAEKELGKFKEPTNWGNIMYALIIVATVLLITFIGVTQFLDYSSISKEIAECRKNFGIMEGQKLSCEQQLSSLKAGVEPPKTLTG